MENSQSLATDSFSYSWLINRKPSFDSLLESLRTSLDCPSETVPVVHHLNKSLKNDQDFDFNVNPGSRSSNSLVDADEIFSDGCIKPVFPNRDQTKIQAPRSLPASPVVSSVTSRTVVSSKNWTKPSNKILQKCFSVLRPFCQRLGCSRKSIRVDDFGRKFLEVRSRSNSQQASPDRRTSYSGSNWADIKLTSCTAEVCKRLENLDVKSLSNYSPQASLPRSPPHYTDAWCDISIDEAILHCKRSFEN